MFPMVFDGETFAALLVPGNELGKRALREPLRPF